MAIDSSLFAADIPAGTYTTGQIIPLGNIAGPANVRSGRGAAVLKNIFSGAIINSGSYPSFRVHVRNSDWVDEVLNLPSELKSTDTGFDPDSGQNQIGHDCELTANSGWQVYGEVVGGATSTNAMSLFTLIDIDYPSVSAVQNPSNAIGVPTSIPFDKAAAVVNAAGAMTAATWQVENVDYFKAGYKYCLEKVEMVGAVNGAPLAGFVAFANAAGMGGLQRIIPLNTNSEAIRYPIRYASTLVKGPMDVKTMFFAATAGTENVFMSHDFVKRGA